MNGIKIILLYVPARLGFVLYHFSLRMSLMILMSLVIGGEFLREQAFFILLLLQKVGKFVTASMYDMGALIKIVQKHTYTHTNKSSFKNGITPLWGADTNQ